MHQSDFFQIMFGMNEFLTFSCFKLSRWLRISFSSSSSLRILESSAALTWQWRKDLQLMYVECQVLKHCQPVTSKFRFGSQWVHLDSFHICALRFLWQGPEVPLLVSHVFDKELIPVSFLPQLHPTGKIPPSGLWEISWVLELTALPRSDKNLHILYETCTWIFFI